MIEIIKAGEANEFVRFSYIKSFDTFGYRGKPCIKLEDPNTAYDIESNGSIILSDDTLVTRIKIKMVWSYYE